MLAIKSFAGSVFRFKKPRFIKKSKINGRNKAPEINDKTNATREKRAIIKPFFLKKHAVAVIKPMTIKSNTIPDTRFPLLFFVKTYNHHSGFHLNQYA